MRLITPLPPTRGARAYVLVGGTFDPPHLAHVRLADEGRRAAGLADAWLVFVPAATSPFKQGIAAGASPADRVNMLRLAIGETPRSVVWTDEVDRAEEGDPSYWIETLERFRSIVEPVSIVRFILGTDQVALFHRWRRAADILELADPIVLPRDPVATRDQLARTLEATGAWTPRQVARWLQWMVDVPRDSSSSSIVREGLAAAADQPTQLPVHPGVAQYIKDHGLYRAARA